MRLLTNNIGKLDEMVVSLYLEMPSLIIEIVG